MTEKILIIDDELSICTSIKFALEDKYDVSYTTNPNEGIKKLIMESYNLVLLDLKIGNVDGINVLQEIKNIDNSIQVIIMTAFGTIMSSVDTIKKGAYTYLTKPLNLGDIRSSGYKYVELNKITTVNYDGLTQNLTMFQSDGVHPTNDTFAKMFQKYKIDVPELFII
jgi:two-component system response regulator AtoC